MDCPGCPTGGGSPHTCHDQCGSGLSETQSERTKSNPGGRTDGSVTRKPFQTIWSDQSSFQEDKEENSGPGNASHTGCLDRRRTLGGLNMSSKDGRFVFAWICPITLETASCRRKLAGTMLLRTGSHGSGVERRVPVIVLSVVFSWTSTRLTWALRHQTGAQYSATEKHSARAAVRSVDVCAPHVEPASLLMMLFLVRTFAAVFMRWSWYVSDRSRVTPRYTGFVSHFSDWPFSLTSIFRLALALCRWKTHDTVLATLGCKRHFLQ